MSIATCGIPGVETLPPRNAVLPVAPGAPVRLGVRLQQSKADFVVDEVRVDVLAAGAVDDAAAVRAGTLPRVARHVERDLAAADRDVAFLFDGTADDGSRLPPGDYLVTYAVRSHAIEGRCENASAARWDTGGRVATVRVA